MKKYDYEAAVCADIREYLRFEQEYGEGFDRFEYDRDAFEDYLNDNLWTEDSVTGNGSGSYTFSSLKAEENLVGNFDLLCSALEDFGAGAKEYRKYLENPEWADVTIRCWLLSGCICQVLDEIYED